MTQGYVELWRSTGALERGAGCAGLPAFSGEVACEAIQHKYLPCAACCSHELTMTCAACLQELSYLAEGTTDAHLRRNTADAIPSVGTEDDPFSDDADGGNGWEGSSPGQSESSPGADQGKDGHTGGRFNIRSISGRWATLAARCNGSAWHCHPAGWLMHALAWSYDGYCSGATQEGDGKIPMADGSELEQDSMPSMCCLAPEVCAWRLPVW